MIFSTRRDEAPQRLAKPEHGHFGDGVSVDAIASQRLAHPDIVEGRFGVIEGDIDALRIRSLQHLDLGVFREPLHHLFGDIVDEVHLARPQRGGARHPLLHDLELNAVEIRQALLVVVRVLLEDDDLVWLPLGQLEGTRASGMQGCVFPPPGLVAGGRLNLEAHAIDRHGRQEGLCWILQGELDGVRIEGLDRLEKLEEWANKGLFFLVHDAFEVPGHGGGIEVGAVMEFHALPQPEHVDLTVLLCLPGLSQLGNVVQVLIDGYQIVEQVPGDICHLQAGGPMRIEAGDILLPRHP